MAFGSAALKLLQTALHGIEFCCAAIILGIYSYFLSVLADRDLTIGSSAQAVEALSGAAVLYTLLGVLLTWCLGGKALFAFLGILFDLLFAGAFVAMAVLTRDGAHSCRGTVHTPLGRGDASSKQGFGSANGQGDQVTFAASLGTICRLNTACFVVAIIGAVLFLLSALVQLFIGRKHQRDKRLGPAPARKSSRGRGLGCWGRKRRRTSRLHDAEMAGAVPAAGMAAPAHGHGAHDYRPSHDTAYTGSTVAVPNAPYENSQKPMSGGYYTAPTGTYRSTPATNY